MGSTLVPGETLYNVMLDTGKLSVDTGLGGHRNCQSCSVSVPSARPFKSMVGTLAFSAILLLRGVPVGVVYAVMIKSEKWSHHGLEQTNRWCDHGVTLTVPVPACPVAQIYK